MFREFALIAFVNLLLRCQVSYWLSLACTKEQEGLGGVELANGVFPHQAQKHCNARTSSVATNIGGMNANDCGGEPVRDEMPLCVCSVVSLFPPSKPLRKSSACSGPVL